ncbi:SAM-dependent methyltransferase [Thermoleophilia bacterium SCSIO 60948]|nr:SAM-dependent methyltransferase [Thermoleophilia bacterium SCSIO 60948]
MAEGPEPRPVTPLDLVSHHLGRALELLGDDADPALRAELDRADALARGLGPYAELMSSPESPALGALDRLTRVEDWGARDRGVALEQEMLSGRLEGRLLAFLVAATGARNVLEIGMFSGYSALAMAEALPPDGSLVACEIDAGVADFARRRFDASPSGERIDIRIAPALATLASLVTDEERFDLVFIDADKPSYEDYLDAILAGGLLAPDGIVCVDNTLLQGEPYLGEDVSERSRNGAAIAAFNERVAADPELEQVLLPVRDGVTLIRRTGPRDG